MKRRIFLTSIPTLAGLMFGFVGHAPVAGMNNWHFDMDKPEQVARIVTTVLKMVNDPNGARQKTAAALKKVRVLQKQTRGVLKEIVNHQ